MKWLLIAAIFATCECSKRAILLPPTPATLCKGGFSRVLWGSHSAHALLPGAPGWVISQYWALTALHGKIKRPGWSKVLFMGFSLICQAGESLLFAGSRKAMRHRGIYVPDCIWCYTLATQQPQTITGDVYVLGNVSWKSRYVLFGLWSECSPFHYTILSTTAGSLNQGKWGHNKVQVISAIVF